MLTIYLYSRLVCSLHSQSGFPGLPTGSREGVQVTLLPILRFEVLLSFGHTLSMVSLGLGGTCIASISGLDTSGISSSQDKTQGISDLQTKNRSFQWALLTLT